ncbi:superoxide dismutase [Cu-Zn]-like isoform X2 [Lycorma delicatula]|uniref:superoxide dismutase [Cu-Zn]-like isoform X2 n=1 Tax=Lycorma delicatula TaxID=130591 RepID=UPI003F50FA1F
MVSNILVSVLVPTSFLITFASSVLLNEGRPLPGLPDRSLYIRSIPELFGYSGSLYQAPHPLNAVVVLRSNGADGDVQGTITFVQPHPPGGPVFLTGNVTGLTPGKHGFHIHSYGDLREGCESLGPHFNPFLVQHGGPTDPYRHVGDLGNIVAGDDGVAKIQISDHLISLTGPHNVIGRGLVVKANPDDLGRGGDQESLVTGNAGSRVSCGIIAIY